MTPQRSWRRSLGWSAAGVVALVAVVGALHLPAARPFIGMLEALCPAASVPAEQVERMQLEAANTLRGPRPLPHGARGRLRLLEWRRSDVTRWAHTSGAACAETTRGFAYVNCRRVPTDDRGDVAWQGVAQPEVTFTFDHLEELRGVEVLARLAPGPAAADLIARLEQQLVSTLGPADRTVGDVAVPAQGTPFATASRAYGFTDAAVQLSITMIPGSGVVVREQYLRLTPSAPES